MVFLVEAQCVEACVSQELHHLSTVIDEGKGDVTLHSMKGGGLEV
jgi:hypothetical protein